LLIDQLRRQRYFELHHIDLGGGLGIRYQDDDAPTVKSYLQPLLQKLKGRGLKILLEPGRRLVGNAGVLLTRVEYLKPGEVKNFAIVDAAMNDLGPPGAVRRLARHRSGMPRAGEPSNWEIVGPICESSDFLGHGVAGHRARRSAGGHVCWRLRHGDEFKLQHAPARRGGHG
jgi:diaminopimelate decarboxylase